MKNKFYTYKGAIHIHSIFSDGTGNIEEISKAAKNAGLSWIIITDHNNMEIEEGFYNGVCVIKGEEISPKNTNHYIALDIKQNIQPYINPQNYIEEVRTQGGFGFAAHPNESDERKNNAPPIKWIDKSIIPDGVEIWNWFSDWADNYDESNIFKIIYAYLFRNNLIKGPKSETLKWWDELNNKTDKIVPAIVGVDAHALKITKYIIPVKIFPYESMFKTLINILILDEELPQNFDAQRKIILQSIKEGKNIMMNNQLKNETPIIYLSDNALNVKLLVNSKIKVLFNGDIIYSTNGKCINYKIEKKGKYRVEVYLKNKPWIYSNPFSIV